MIDFPHVASRVFGTPLMIARAKLDVILGVLAPRLTGSVSEAIDANVVPAPQTSMVAEGIAVVSVAGTLVSRSGYLDAASGLLSYADIGDAIAGAMDDPSVRGVILDVDSAGGEVGGLFDLIDRQRFARRSNSPTRLGPYIGGSARGGGEGARKSRRARSRSRMRSIRLRRAIAR